MKILLLSVCCFMAVAASAASQTVDPTLAEIARVAKTQHNRFEVIRKTVNRYDPAKTNLFVRPARASMQTKLTNARAKAVEFYTSFTNELAHSAALSNTLAIVNGQLDAAHAKINDEIADLQAKKAEYLEKAETYKSIKLLKAYFEAKATDAENRIKILQALTGGAQ